jgi:hypothetical protein
METSWKDILSNISDEATIFAFLWAVYEFYYKRRFKIKAVALPSPVNFKSTEYIVNIKVINLSEQSLKRTECSEEQTWFDKLFRPKLKIVLKTTMEREIRVIIDKYYSKEVDVRVNKLFKNYKNDNLFFRQTP